MNKKSILCHLTAFAWLAFLLIGLIAEVVIQVDYTKVRPHADSRTGDVILMVCIVWAWVSGRAIQRQDLNHLGYCSGGAVLGIFAVVILAALGGSTPPVAGALLLSASLASAIIFK